LMASVDTLSKPDFIAGLMPDRDQRFSKDWSRIRHR
jgi:hypothetical protein